MFLCVKYYKDASFYLIYYPNKVTLHTKNNYRKKMNMLVKAVLLIETLCRTPQ